MIKRVAHCFAVLGLFAGMIACGGGGGGSNQTVSITLNGTTNTVAVGGQLSFTATVTGTSNTAVTWTVNGVTNGNGTVGTIQTSLGDTQVATYTAPATVPATGAVTLIATSQADTTKTAGLQITITGSGTGVTVVVSPSGSTNTPFEVETFATQQFTATVTGASSSAVTWTISCQVGASACGAISSTGLYVAPNSVPTFESNQGVTNDLVVVTATSVASPGASGSSSVYVKPLNQNALNAPVQLGSSGSNVNATCLSGGGGFCFGGTLGSLLTRGGTNYIMSNNHVLGLSDAGVAGQVVTQPGEIETNCSTNGTTSVATLTSFVTLNPPPAVPVDVSIAQVTSGKVDTGGNILELGNVSNGIPQPAQVVAGSGMAATIGEAVAKSGRTTGLTCASVESIAIDNVRVGYEQGCSTTTTFSVTYQNQISVGETGNHNNFIAEGDSGSLMVDEATATPVGLLFAGSSGTAIANPIGAVLSALTTGSAPTFVGTNTPHGIPGCSLPAPSADGVVAKGANVPAATASLSASVKQAALAAQDRNAADLLNVEGVSAVGTGASLDSPGEAAMLVFLPSGASTASVPLEINGIRTRIVESNSNLRGSLNGAQTAQVMAAALQSPVSVGSDAITHAITVKDAHKQELSSHSSVQGVGVAASLDAPGEAAIMVYVLKGQPHEFVPASYDGVRTRVKETTEFKAGVSLPHRAAACVLAKPATASKSNVAASSTAQPSH
jgi:hypothetical protein